MANSFRQMRDKEVIKRTDSGMFIRIDELHVKPDFNRREDDERTRQADDELFNYLMNGGTQALITSAPALGDALAGRSGTFIVRETGGFIDLKPHRPHPAK